MGSFPLLVHDTSATSPLAAACFTRPARALYTGAPGASKTSHTSNGSKMEFGSREWMACMGEGIKMFNKASSRFKEVHREYNQAQEALSNAQTQKLDEEKIAQLQAEVARIWEVLVQERKVVDDAMIKYLYLPDEYSYLVFLVFSSMLVNAGSVPDVRTGSVDALSVTFPCGLRYSDGYGNARERTPCWRRTRWNRAVRVSTPFGAADQFIPLAQGPVCSSCCGPRYCACPMQLTDIGISLGRSLAEAGRGAESRLAPSRQN